MTGTACLRDERGWRIPRYGTLSRKVYDLHLTGLTATEIAAKLKKPLVNVAVLIHKFKNPDKSNTWALGSYHRGKAA